jgi:hypothetical protein
MALFHLRFIMLSKLLIILLSVACFSAPGEHSFTPTEVQFWVEKIVLSSDMSSSGVPRGETLTLYECTDNDCYLEVSDNNMLETLDMKYQLKQGAYRYLTVTTCSGGANEFFAKVRGVATIDGTPYYTHSTEALMEQLAAESPQVVTLSFTQCEYYYELQQDFMISDSIETPLTLFVDLENSAWGRKGVQSIESGCFEGQDAADGSNGGADGIVMSVCLSVPHMIPIASELPPNIQRYHIYKSGELPSTAGGMIVLFVDDDSQLLGGFSRRLYTTTSVLPNIEWFDMALKRATLKSNGVYAFETFGVTFNSLYLEFEQFSLDNHSGETYSGSSGIEYGYQAQKQ